MVKKHIPFHKHQVPDHDEMLAKWPGCKTTSTDLRNQLKDKETLHKMGIYLLLAVFQGQANSMDLIKVNNDSKETQED